MLEHQIVTLVNSRTHHIKEQEPLLALLPLSFRLITHRIAHLYEQRADSVRIGQYVRKWREWVHGGGHA